MRARTAALLLPLLLTACGGNDVTPPGSYTLEGRWTGTAGDPGDVLAFTFDLEQSARNDVSGTVTVAGGQEPLELDVSGDWDYPSFELLLSAPGYQDVVYSGNFARSDSIDGTLSGSGFTNERLAIRRAQ